MHPLLRHPPDRQPARRASDFGDFELYLDWKIQGAGDSGVFPRNMPQVQIWDPAGGGNGNVVGSGGLDNNGPEDIPPKKKADKPVGEWNTFYIKMVGDRIWVEASIASHRTSCRFGPSKNSRPEGFHGLSQALLQAASGVPPGAPQSLQSMRRNAEHLRAVRKIDPGATWIGSKPRCG